MDTENWTDNEILVRVTLSAYGLFLEEFGIKPISIKQGGNFIEHLAFLCNAKPHDPARAIGWIQGSFCAKSIFSFAELEDHVRVLRRFAHEKTEDEIFHELYSVIQFQYSQKRDVKLKGPSF